DVTGTIEVVDVEFMVDRRELVRSTDHLLPCGDTGTGGIVGQQSSDGGFVNGPIATDGLVLQRHLTRQGMVVEGDRTIDRLTDAVRRLVEEVRAGEVNAFRQHSTGGDVTHLHRTTKVRRALRYNKKEIEHGRRKDRVPLIRYLVRFRQPRR